MMITDITPPESEECVTVSSSEGEEEEAVDATSILGITPLRSLVKEILVSLIQHAVSTTTNVIDKNDNYGTTLNESLLCTPSSSSLIQSFVRRLQQQEEELENEQEEKYTQVATSTGTSVTNGSCHVNDDNNNNNNDADNRNTTTTTTTTIRNCTTGSHNRTILMNLLLTLYITHIRPYCVLHIVDATSSVARMMMTMMMIPPKKNIHDHQHSSSPTAPTTTNTTNNNKNNETDPQSQQQQRQLEQIRIVRIVQWYEQLISQYSNYNNNCNNTDCTTMDHRDYYNTTGSSSCNSSSTINLHQNHHHTANKNGIPTDVVVSDVVLLLRQGLIPIVQDLFYNISSSSLTAMSSSNSNSCCCCNTDPNSNNRLNSGNCCCILQLALLRCIYHTLTTILQMIRNTNDDDDDDDSIVTTTSTNNNTNTNTNTNCTTATTPDWSPVISLVRYSICLFLGYTTKTTGTISTGAVPSLLLSSSSSSSVLPLQQQQQQQYYRRCLTSYLFHHYQENNHYYDYDYFYNCPSTTTGTNGSSSCHHDSVTATGTNSNKYNHEDDYIDDDVDDIIMSYIIRNDSAGSSDIDQQDYVFHRCCTTTCATRSTLSTASNPPKLFNHRGCCTTRNTNDDQHRGINLENNNNNNDNSVRQQMELQTQQIWEQLYELVVITTTLCTNSNNKNNDGDDDPNMKQHQQQHIIQLLQYDKMIQCLHSYYFLDVSLVATSITKPSISSEQPQQYKLHLGQLIASNQSTATNETDRNNKSDHHSVIHNYDAAIHRDHCICTLIQFILYLIGIMKQQQQQSRSEINDTTTTSLTTILTVDECIFPMLYTLLNSTKQKEIRIGAILVYHVLSYLLHVYTTTNRIEIQRQMRNTLPPIIGNLNIILQQFNRIGSTLWVIGYTQRILFQLQTSILTTVVVGTNKPQQQLPRNPNQQPHPTKNSIDDVTEYTTLLIYKSIQEWLHVIDRNNRHYTQNHLIVGLVMGIVPIMYDQTSHMYNITHNSSNNNVAVLPYGIEIARLGLSSFLPILNGESGYDEIFRMYNNNNNNPDDPILLLNTDDGTVPAGTICDNVDANRKTLLMSIRISGMVQLTTLAAISNLLIMAYPIMYRHSGKILCTLIAYIRRLRDANVTKTELRSNSDSTSSTSMHVPLFQTTVSLLRESILQRAVYVAAMATVIGGESAMVVLNKIDDCDRYDKIIIDIVHTIRLEANKLIK